MEKTESASYQLFLGLDEPSDECTRFSEKISLRGWLLAPKGSVDFKESSIPAVRVLLEEHSPQQTTLRAGLGFVGEELGLERRENGAYLEELSVCRADPGDPDAKNNLGTVFRISGTVNFSAHLPRADEPPRAFSLSLLANIGPKVSVSNSSTFSIEPRSRWSSAFGGFLYPAGGELHSEFLLLRGWAVRSEDPLERVVLCLNGVDLGEAVIGLKSPEQGGGLPDVKEAENCVFEKILWRGDFSDPQEISGVLNIGARAEFKSGEILNCCLPALIWFPEVSADCDENSASLEAGSPNPETEPACPEKRPAAINQIDLQGRIESVTITSKKTLQIEGWLLNPGLFGESLFLEGSYCSADLSAGSDDAPAVRWCHREEIARRFPSAGHDKPCGFIVEVNPLILGPHPGLVRLLAQDIRTKKMLPLGPSKMWDVISQLIVQQADQRQFKGRVLQKALVWGSQLGCRKRFYRENKQAKTKYTFPQRVLVATHNLSAVEGAPKVLFQVINRLSRAESFSGEVLLVSPYDGDLRTDFETLGVQVQVVPELALFEQTWQRYHQGLDQLATLCREFAPDLVYANVIDSFWAIDLARRLAVPSLWSVHESIDPRNVHRHLDARLRLKLLTQVLSVDRMIFVARETEELFLPFLGQNRTVVIPNGVDVPEIERFRREMTKETAREELGVSAEEVMVSVIGTTAYRKGQDVFIREMALLEKLMPENRFAFFVVGARELDFLDELKHLASTSGIKSDLRFVPETPRVSTYFIASDILVISSRQESAPLVSLEAFAYETPLVSTRVFGLAEQICHGENALGFDLNTSGDLAGQVKELLEDKELSSRLVAGGRQTLEEKFRLDISLGRYVEEIAGVFAQYNTDDK